MASTDLWEKHIQVLRNVAQMLETRAGRDKLFRSWGYALKTAIALIELSPEGSPYTETLNNVAKNLSESRRTWRLFIFVNNWLSLIKAVRTNKDRPLLHVLACTKAIANVIFILLDNFVWLGKVRLVDMDVKAWNRRAMQFWFWGAFFGALKCAVELAGVNASQRFVCKEIEGIERKQRKRSKQDDDELVDVEDARLSEMRTRNSALDLKRHLLTVEIIKNIGDWPAASEGGFELGWFSPLMCASTGLVASLSGWYLVWPPFRP